MLISPPPLTLSSYLKVPVSRHRLLLSWIPLANATASLFHQRKVTLHGSRVREFPEDLVEREVRKEIRTVLPDLFEGQYGDSFSYFSLCLTGDRYDQGRLWVIERPI